MAKFIKPQLTIRLNAIAISNAIRDATLMGMGESLYRMEATAKAKAPVRKVVTGGRRTFRAATRSELQQANRYYQRVSQERGFTFTPLTTIRVVNDRFENRGYVGRGRLSPRTGANRANVMSPRASNVLDRSPDALAQNPRLSSRGRYELNSGRATIQVEANRDEVGGWLRDHIEAQPVEVRGGHLHGELVSIMDADHQYPKFQELGSRHNPAHPYLRPALHAERLRYRATLIKHIAAVKIPGVQLVVK
jgi:hypothetical protein